MMGAGLGWVHFSGTETEPGRAGPALALHLERIYTEFLTDFDQQYLRQLINHRRLVMQQQAAKQMASNLENGVHSQNRPQGPQTLADIKDPKLMSEIVQCANLSVQEMQQCGIGAHIIQIVDRYRDQLKAMLDQQTNLVKNIQHNLPQGSMPPGQRSVSNSMNGMAHPQPGING